MILNRKQRRAIDKLRRTKSGIEKLRRMGIVQLTPAEREAVEKSSKLEAVKAVMSPAERASFEKAVAEGRVDIYGKPLKPSTLTGRVSYDNGPNYDNPNGDRRFTPFVDGKLTEPQIAAVHELSGDAVQVTPAARDRRPGDCDHENEDGSSACTDKPTTHCLRCGMEFAYCNACSSEAGNVYHEPPVCPDGPVAS